MHAHTGVFGPAVRTNASRLGREVRNGGYPVWAICRLQAVLFYIFNRFDDIKHALLSCGRARKKAAIDKLGIYIADADPNRLSFDELFV